MKNVELGSSLSDIIALGARLNVSLDFRNVETVTASTLRASQSASEYSVIGRPPQIAKCATVPRRSL